MGIDMNKARRAMMIKAKQEQAPMDKAVKTFAAQAKAFRAQATAEGIAEQVDQAMADLKATWQAFRAENDQANNPRLGRLSGARERNERFMRQAFEAYAKAWRSVLRAAKKHGWADAEDKYKYLFSA